MAMMNNLACCCDDCFLFTDAFTRADSDTVGTGWTETSGDFDIVSNKCSTSGTGTLTQNTAPTADGAAPSRAADFDMSVTVQAGADNVVVKVGMHDLLAVLDFAANTVGFEGPTTICSTDFTLGASTAYVVRVIWKDPHGCILINGVCVYSQEIEDTELVAASPTLRVTTNPTPTAVTFDDYSIEVHSVNQDCIVDCESVECGEQQCGDCQDNTEPYEYQVVIAGIVDGGLCTANTCLLYNGTYILEQCWCRALVHADECATSGTTPQNECMWAIGYTDASICSCNNGLVCLEHRDYVRLTIGADAKVQIRGDTVDRYVFTHATFVSGNTCLFSAANFPQTAGGSQCGGTATCTVTAL